MPISVNSFLMTIHTYRKQQTSKRQTTQNEILTYLHNHSYSSLCMSKNYNIFLIIIAFSLEDSDIRLKQKSRHCGEWTKICMGT